MPPARAVIFDFNGTVSDDEPILYEIFAALFAQRGRPLTRQQYVDELAGLPDVEVVRRWLGSDHPELEQVVEERVERYRAAVADGSTVSEDVREAVRCAAALVPVAIVSGASRREIAPVLAAAGLAPVLRTTVAAEDVADGKPHPAGYLRALELLDEGLRADEVVVFEDTEAGVAAAKAAGMRCVAVAGTLPPDRLAAADELVPRLDVAAVRRQLGLSGSEPLSRSGLGDAPVHAEPLPETGASGSEPQS